MNEKIVTDLENPVAIEAISVLYEHFGLVLAVFFFGLLFVLYFVIETFRKKALKALRNDNQENSSIPTRPEE